MNFWREFDEDDQARLLRLSEQILNDELTVVEGAYQVWSIVKDRDFGACEELNDLEGLVLALDETDRGEARLYAAELLKQKDHGRKTVVEVEGPIIKAMASKIMRALKPHK